MRRGARLTLLLLPLLAALPLAGCGGASAGTGASSSTTSASPSGVSPAAATAAAVARAQRHASQPVGRDIVSDESHQVHPARGVGSEPNDEVNSSGAKQQDPCTLVSAAEAQAIVGKPVGQPTEAPQGPTCIYRPQGAKNFITLAVESKDFSKIEPQSQLHSRTSLTVGGHSAYCGTVGTPTLIVPLSAGRFMSVTASCPVAAAFATKALSRLG